MTRVVRFTEFGGPDVLQVVETDLGAPGPGEALIDVAAIGLNRAESMFRTGTYIEPTRLPAGLGYEAAGTVRAVGEGVTRWTPGDPVSCVPAFSMNDYTVYGEQAIVPARALVPRPVDEITGAAEVIATGEEDLTARALELTDGRGLDVVFDAVAGPAVEQMANAVRPDGTIVIHGRLSGEPTIFPTATLPDLVVRSFTLFAMTRDEDRLRRAAAFVSAGLRAGDFAPQVDRVFDGLDRVVEAHEYLESNAQVGKIVLRP